MSIMIQGMEMPKTCCQCDLKVYDPELRWEENGIEQIGAWVCKRTRKIIWNTQRGENCPLVSLPEGHGRLGDLDKLVANFRESAEECKRLADAVESDPLTEVNNKVIYPAIIEAILRIKAAPTIVPAEGGGEDG